jgi:hypothetical protein
MMFAVIVSMLALQGSLMSNVTVLFMAVPLTGTFLAALAYLFTLPYIILTFKCEFYRKRFFACLRLSKPVNGAEISLPPDMSEKF